VDINMIGKSAPRTETAKPRPSRKARSEIERQALLARLSERPSERLVLIEAPAGYGKTTLLEQFYAEHEARGDHIVWISADDADTADDLTSRVAIALEDAGFALPTSEVVRLSENGLEAAGAMTLLQRIERCGRSCTLIMDDAEKLSIQAMRLFVDVVVRLQPDNLRLLMACRQNPGVDTSIHAIEGRLLHLGPEQLRLSDAEIAAVLHEKLKTKDLEQFVQEINGWPAALEVVEQTLGAPTGRAASALQIESCLGRVSDRFKSQVLIHASVQERGFIEEAAALGSFTAAMMDFVGCRHDSASLIRRIRCRFVALVQAGDHSSEVYFVHPLLKREWVARAATARRPAGPLYGRAAQWCYSVGEKVQAVRYALWTDDYTMAVAYFEKMGGLTLSLTEGMLTLTQMMTLLHEERAERFPRVLAAISLVHLKSGQIGLADEYFQRARSFLEEGERGTADPLVYELALLELLLSQYGYRGLKSDCQRQNLRLLMSWGEYEPAMRGFIAIIQCLVHLQSGAFELARFFGNNALAEAMRCRSSYEELHGYIHLGAERLVAGRRDEALAYYRRSLAIAQSEFAADQNLEYRCHVFLGELFWEYGEVGAARKHIKYVIKHQHPLDSTVEISMAAFKVCCEYLYYHEGPRQAVAYIEQVRQGLIQDGRERLITFTDALLLFVHCQAGRADLARTVAQRLRPIIALSHATGTWREVEMFTLSLIRIARLDDQVAQAESYLDRLLEVADRTANRRLLSYALAEKAVLEIGHSEATSAHETLGQMFELVKLTRYLRPVINQLRHIGPTLEAVWSDRPGGEQLLRDALDAAEGHNGAERYGGLSSRQIEVLGELCKKQSDKRIARNLGLTPDGVRYHLKAIYTQLSVSTRAAAIQLAHERGLV
jgi:LuxR family transcriptional regulator, maltose regulon positive regulatory protein